METPDFKQLAQDLDAAVEWLQEIDVAGGTPIQVQMVTSSISCFSLARVWALQLEKETADDPEQPIRKRTPGEQKSYTEGMLAGALKVRIKTEGEFKGDVRRAEEWVKSLAQLLERTDQEVQK